MTNQTNRKWLHFSLLSAALMAASSTVAQAEKTATPISAKMGYFNLQLVKANYPEAAVLESTRKQAEDQLRRDLETYNKKVQEAVEAKKPQAEIEKMKSEYQITINAENLALSNLIQRQTASSNAAIYQAVEKVAKDKGLDLVVDSSTFVIGGDKLLNNGIDVTNDVSKMLSPHEASVPPAK